MNSWHNSAIVVTVQEQAFENYVMNCFCGFFFSQEAKRLLLPPLPLPRDTHTRGANILAI